MTKNMPYIDLTLQDLVTKVKALNKSAFAAGFAEKLASLPLDAKRDILAQLYALGVTKQANNPIPKSIPQAPKRQNYGLGSQYNMLGKELAPIPGEDPEPAKPDPISMEDPLKGLLQATKKHLGVNQLTAPPAFRGKS